MKNRNFLRELLSFMFCIFASRILLENPAIGAAYFIIAESVILGIKLLESKQRPFISTPARAAVYGLIFLFFIATLAMVFVYPAYIKDKAAWLLFTLVLIVFIRREATERLYAFKEEGRLSCAKLKLFSLYLMLSLNLLVGIMLLILVRIELVWPILLGFFITSIGYMFSYKAPKKQFVNKPINFEALIGISSFKKYRSLAFALVIAQQFNFLIFFSKLAFDFWGLTLIALPIGILSLKIAEGIFKAYKDPTNSLIASLVIWIVGLLIYFVNPQNGVNNVFSILALLLCASSMTLSHISLSEINNKMPEVLSFSGSLEEAKYAGEVINSFAGIIGKMLALIYLVVQIFLKDKSAFTLNKEGLLPSLLLVILSCVLAFRFPLRLIHFNKLANFLKLKSEGGNNLPLQMQLESSLIKAQKRHFGIKILAQIVRPFVRCKVIGRENIPENKDGDIIYLCNHSEIFGPISAFIYTKMPLRPWVISELCDPAKVREYVYQGSFEKIRFLPKFIKRGLAYMVSPIIIWGMNSVEPIPVYRNQPNELLKTFRQSLNAMQAGDNLLIFPENPFHEDMYTGQYLKAGVGKFFDGFCAIAPTFYSKTGRKCLFVPIYTSKKDRTITYLKPIEFNPENAFKLEAERICETAREEMLSSIRK